MVDIGRATAKWSSRAAGAQAEYRAGVQGQGSKWLSNAIASEPHYQAMLTESFGRGARPAGLSAVGAAGWEQAAVQKGAANYVTGVRAPMSAQKYQANFGPILAAIQSAVMALPPRGAPMSAENLARAQAVWAAAHAAAGGSSPGQMPMAQPSVTAAAAPTYQMGTTGTPYTPTY